ncbi:MAG: lysine--tRNA ligase [Thermoplasmata archaeon]|nr:lysine--tRNA ligase [Thermoplasmata archaeon]
MNLEELKSFYPELNPLIQARLEKRVKMEGMGLRLYPYKFEKNTSAREIQERFANQGHELSDEVVRIAGRLMLVREHGKASFAHIKDGTGSIQVYAKLDNLGEARYGLWKELDVGDIIGIRGRVFRTKRGELTVSIDEFEILCKSLRPLPEKYHGIKDIELRYRKRYLDLIMNPEAQRIFTLRSKIVSEIRRELEGQGFLEVETPVLQSVASGAAARPFITHHNYLDQDFYLRIAHELHLKRLIVGGFEKVFEIGKAFRNEDVDAQHNPEYTLLELYWAYVDYNDIMGLTENLVHKVALNVLGKEVIEYQGKTIDLRPPWKRISFLDALKNEGIKIDVDKITKEEAYKIGESVGAEIKPDFPTGKILVKIFEKVCEEKLTGPVHIYDYPVEVCPLTKPHRSNPGLAERFESYIAGMEVANAYSELNDPAYQRKMFMAQLEERKRGEAEIYDYDEDFCEALDYGMPPTGGLGIGIDRIVMILTNAPSIKEVILFPTVSATQK